MIVCGWLEDTLIYHRGVIWFFVGVELVAYQVKGYIEEVGFRRVSFYCYF